MWISFFVNFSAFINSWVELFIIIDLIVDFKQSSSNFTHFGIYYIGIKILSMFHNKIIQLLSESWNEYLCVCFDVQNLISIRETAFSELIWRGIVFQKKFSQANSDSQPVRLYFVHLQLWTALSVQTRRQCSLMKFQLIPTKFGVNSTSTPNLSVMPAVSPV